jgi:hypothetical protein
MWNQTVCAQRFDEAQTQNATSRLQSGVIVAFTQALCGRFKVACPLVGMPIK